MIPKDRKYTQAHEWVKEQDGELIVGITEHAQEELGDITFIEMPEVDEKYEQGADCAEIESVKAASEIYMPITGVISAINEELEDEPEKVNNSPFEQGWIIKIKDYDQSQLNELLDAEGYSKFLEDSQ